MRSGIVVIAVLVLFGFVVPAPAGAADDPSKAVGKVVELGLPEAAEVSWTELVVAVPVRVRPVGISGHVNAIQFADMALNGIPFEVDPYTASFDLPEKEPITLDEPLLLRVRFSDVAPGVLQEALVPSDRLRLTGRVAIDGTFRKLVFSVRRSVEVPIDVERPNPIAKYHPLKVVLAELQKW